MKKLHLLCNAHLDPVWLWRRNEGMAAALSTFRVAADFCEKYDGFIFNHNEAILYEWVEEHEPALFERIKKLVAQGKWKIMGGWYLQPDCVMTSGESLLSQIDLGHEYFMEKFGKLPTTAINFDPFGHTRGLVQILTKRGYDSYLHLRPEEDTPRDYIWEGFDGSQVLAHKIYEGYGTNIGVTIPRIEKYTSEIDKEVGLILWGVGNHGGGPSKIELEAINEYIKNSDMEIVHSCSEDYMKEIDRTTLPVFKKSIGPTMVGCYTSMARIKQANRRVENKLAVAEKIMSCAEIEAGAEFDYAELKKAKKALAFCQFHDILPGSAIKPVEDDSLRTFGYAEEIADRLYDKAFFALCQGQPKGKGGEIPILIFNPHPYEIEGEFQMEYLLEDQNWNIDEETIAKVYDKEGNFLPTQNEQSYCPMYLDWTKRIAFRAKVAPSSITRFDCKLEVIKKDTARKETEGDTIIVKNDRMTVAISKKTGLIEEYTVDGKKYIENSGKIEVYRGEADPWGYVISSYPNYECDFTLMSDKGANEVLGYGEETVPNVRITEDGEVRMKIQATFEYKKNTAIIEYTIPKQDAYIDVDITMYSNEPFKMFKYRIDSKLSGKPYGETAFGVDEMFSDGTESVFHKWCGIRTDNDALYVINRGTYGGDFTDSAMKISLLSTSAYSALTIGEDRPITPTDRFMNHIDIGERQFSFRITTEENISRQAQIFNEMPQAISFFPTGEGKKCESVVDIDNPKVIMSSMRKTDDGYKLTLYNSEEAEANATVTFGNKKEDLHFGKFELKEIVFKL